ncbi:NAD-dependent epimerase/dehydratase family protein [Muricauda sp. JGD-17]|uniref:NAD-dependent epimerase/dehydratase family protein n=1 Tax=Flagellimonas ochracea TaxID=2696472 RepID=A0A964TDA5_9FLAO|nr:NAD-dependent epimerase/dehydratase family protein [Allomuricauda ochracea]NAY92031.1 NAD-dependent epimerase/dehydratase family protein [Allomuricauda ochracea]
MILVTGGTGLIGSHLLYHLVNQHKKVRALYRSKDSLKKVLHVFGFYSDDPSTAFDKIEWVKGDIIDLVSLDSAFEGIEHVYHSAALISFDPRDYKSLVKANVEGTANVVNLCNKYQVKKLCYVSSIAAIGNGSKGKMVTEENPWHDGNVSVYGLTKHNAELEVWRGTQEGVPAVIVNPGVVIGPGFWRTGSGTFFTYAAKGKKSFLPGGTGFVSVNDVVLSMISLMESNVERERFILVSENWSYKTLFQKIAPKLGVDPPSKKVPFWVLELFWRWDWLRSNIRGKRRRLTKTMMKGLYRQDTYSSEKLKTTLNIDFENLDHAIAFCCERFKSRK